jgi:hypothetical protein
MAIGGRTPGLVAKKGPTRVPMPGVRPSFILGSRPQNLAAPTPGARIAPGPAGTRDYGKPVSGPNVAGFAPGEGP